MPQFTPQAVLSGIALVTLAIALGLLIFAPVPQANHDFVVFILGTLGGAITVAGGSKLADKITNAPGDNPVIQPDAAARS